MLKNNLAGVLKQGSKGSSALGHHRTHNMLVISEIAMALVPLIGAGLLLRSFQHLLEVDPGFRTDHILTMEIQQPALSFAQINQLSQEFKLGEKQSLQFEQIAAQIRALPGVKEAGGIDDLPLGNELRHASRFVIEGQPVAAAGVRPIAQVRTVSLGYFSSLAIPLRAAVTSVKTTGRFRTSSSMRTWRGVIGRKEMRSESASIFARLTPSLVGFRSLASSATCISLDSRPSRHSTRISRADGRHFSWFVAPRIQPRLQQP
jgi:hypothetical protein